MNNYYYPLLGSGVAEGVQTSRYTGPTQFEKIDTGVVENIIDHGFGLTKRVILRNNVHGRCVF